jgi:glucans biosynthesis protein
LTVFKKRVSACGVTRIFLKYFALPIMISGAFAQDWHREDVRFEDIENRAKELSSAPYVASDKEALPAWMKNLTYDQYRDIRFKPDAALWAEGNLPFRAMFFHPGYLFREPVQLHEYTDTHEQDVRLSEAFFDYGPLVGERGPVPAEGGFAGFRLHAPLNKPDVFDELVVFQGASYWRALGKGQRYGISARGIAIDTGAGGGAEEFPSFREFWLQKPKEGETTVRFHALLDGPSCSGAYSFAIQPGADTVVSVKAVVFPRRKVSRFAIAPMSSMFWFGENSRRRFDDFRPEVHDSDGLAIRMGSGERLWRPVTNDTGRLEFSFFRMEKCEGFGLLQRDRRFAAYEDGEAAYDLRPSLWIEPTSDWGAGSVVLMEIPTGNELADNTVAFWEPTESPKPGERVAFSYRQHWTMDEDPAEAGGHVVATRTGVHDWQPEQRTITVEFTGGKLDGLKDVIPEAAVEAIGENAAAIKIQGVAVQALPENRWRAAFQITPAEKDGKLADIGPVELRCVLKDGENFLTETWVYRLEP